MNTHSTKHHLLPVPALAAIAILLSSCYVRLSQEARDDLRKQSRKVQESRNLCTKDFFPGDFTCIEQSGAIDIVFIQREGDPRVEVETTDNLIDSLVVEVVENEEGERMLQIGFNCPVLGRYTHVATVTAPSLSKVVKAGSGDFEIPNGYKGTSLSIISSGSGDVDVSNLNLSDSLFLHLNGSGDIDGDNLRAAVLNLSQSGSGDIDVDGKGGEISIAAAGSGDVDAEDFKADSEGEITQRGSGSVTYTVGNTVHIVRNGKNKVLKTVSVVL